MVQRQDVEAQQATIALLGSVLLLLDKCIPSLPRERSIVAHIRLSSSSQLISNQAPAVVRLFAATGYAASKDRFPAGQLHMTQPFKHLALHANGHTLRKSSAYAECHMLSKTWSMTLVLTIVQTHCIACCQWMQQAAYHASTKHASHAPCCVSVVCLTDSHLGLWQKTQVIDPIHFAHLAFRQRMGWCTSLLLVHSVHGLGLYLAFSALPLQVIQSNTWHAANFPKRPCAAS